MNIFEDQLICSKCFSTNGYAQKQVHSASTGGARSSNTNALASKFGGGGNPCAICTKTVYSAEQVSFEKLVYHSECFKCSLCSAKKSPSAMAKWENDLICTRCFQENGYREKQAKAAGQQHKPTGATSNKFSKFGGGGTKCHICAKTVYPAEAVSYEKQTYHSDCFKCTSCDKKVTPSNCEGKKDADGSVAVYCKKCWNEQGLGRADS